MTIRWSWRLGVLAISMCAASLASAQESEEEVDAARAAAEGDAARGIALSEQGKHEEAIRYFQQAYELSPVPTLGLLYARSLAKTGRLIEAATVYEAALVYDSTGFEPEVIAADEEAKATAKRELAALSLRIPTATIKLEGVLGANPLTDVVVTLDGEPVGSGSWERIRLEPEGHVVRARRGAEQLRVQAWLGGQPSVAGFTAQEGDRWTIVVTEPPPPALKLPRVAPPPPEEDGSRGPTPYRVASRGALGLGAASLVVWSVAGSIAFTKRNQLKDNPYCRTSSRKLVCDPAAHDDVKVFNTARDVSAVAFWTGMAGLSAGVSLLLPEREPDRGAVSARIGPKGIELRGWF